MKPSIVKILSATALGLLAAIEVVTAQSALSSEKKVIASRFSNVEDAMAFAGMRLALECRTKLDNLSDQEVSSILQMLKIETKSLEDPLVSLITERGKDSVSKDCRRIDENALGSAVANALVEYDIRLSKQEYKKEYISEKQFYTAVGIVAAHRCRKIKGFYPSAKSASDQLGQSAIDAGLPLSILANTNVIKAGMKLSDVLNRSCDGFIDNEKAEDILVKSFMNQ